MKKTVLISITIALLFLGSMGFPIPHKRDDSKLRTTDHDDGHISGTRGNTIIVDDGGGQDYSTIQSAVDGAQPGDTIHVLAGKYNERVTIDKTLTLIGDGADNTIIDAGGIGDVVSINANWVNVSGFNITNADGIGIKINGAYCWIDNNLCTDNDYGIQLANSHNNNITNNICTDNDNYGIFLADSSGDNIINKNTCTGNTYAIKLSNVQNNNITNNIISANTCAIHLNIGINNVIYNNICTSNSQGIFLHSSHRNTITYNAFNFNSIGIEFFWDSNYNTISNNNFFHNDGYVITIKDTEGNNYNIVYYNNFINNDGNRVQANDDDSQNTWDNGFGKGNYWSDYFLRYPEASNDDHVWDTPYDIAGDSGAQDHYPLVNPVDQGPYIEQDEFGGSWFDDFEDERGIEWFENVNINEGKVEVKAYGRFKRSITISNIGSALNDYPIPIILNEQNFDYSHVSDNGEDIRFYKNNGNKLSYWIEKWNANGDSIIWVKVSSIPEDTSMISMHYGNPHLKNESNGNAVFEFFDDFDGPDLNPNNWGQWTFNGGGTISLLNSSLKIKANSGQHDVMGIYTLQDFNVPCVFKSSAKTTISGRSSILGLIASSQENPTTSIDNIASFKKELGLDEYTSEADGVNYEIDAQDWNNDDYLDFEIQRDSEGNSAFYINGIIVDNDYDYNSIIHTKLWIVAGGYSDEIYANWAFVRAQALHEPTSSLGNEEMNSINSTVISIPISLSNNSYWSTLSLKKNEPFNTLVSISVIDTLLNQTIPGYNTITARNIDISNITADSIRLEALLNARGLNTSSIDSWGVEWITENAWRDSFIGEGKCNHGELITDRNTMGLWHLNGDCRDDSVNNNDGTSHPGVNFIDGRFGQALSFEGSEDYIDSGNDTSLDIIDEITIEAWIYLRQLPQTWANIVCKAPNGYLTLWNYGLAIDSSGQITFGNGDGISYFVSYQGPNLYDTKWHHVAIAFSNTNIIYYIDGNVVWSGINNVALTTNNDSVEIGRESGEGGYAPFNGIIDEVRISNIARTTEEIRQSYRAGIAIKGGRVQLADNELIPDGNTVCLWHFNDDIGSILHDSSDNENDGEIKGSSLKIDGVDDHIEITNFDNSNLHDSISIEVLFKPLTLGSNIPTLFNIGAQTATEGHIWIYFRDNKIYYQLEKSTGYLDIASNTIDWEMNQWYHLSIIQNNDNNKISLYLNGEMVGTHSFNSDEILEIESDKIYLGTYQKYQGIGSNTYLFNGLIDDVRIYSRTLSETEVREHYNGIYTNESDLVFHIPFNDKTGTTASDISDSEYDGTLYNFNWDGDSGWTDDALVIWTEGRFGSALNFNGVDDYVDCGNEESLDVSEITVGAWINAAGWKGVGEWNYIVGKESDGTTHSWFLDNDQGRLTFLVYVNGNQQYRTSSELPSINEWHHVVGTYDGETIKLYLNGIEISSNPEPSGSIQTNKGHLLIGATSVPTYFGERNFNGIIDEIAIYNRALSPSEIYNHSRLYHPEANLRSETVTLPERYSWSDFHFTRTVPPNTYLNISVHDAATGEILFTDKGDTAELTADVSFIDPRTHSSVYLEAHFQSNRTRTPVLYDWAVSWEEPESPELIYDIDTIFIDEDMPEENVLDFSTYFRDTYSIIENPSYALEHVSDELNITLQINGFFLDVAWLAENWTGNISIIVNCTNRYGLAASSNMFNITVLDVNDAPQTELLSPENGAIVNDMTVNLRWNVLDVDTNRTSLTFDLFLSQSQAPELYSTGLMGKNITISNLENGTTYYWYVIPSDTELEGICLNGTWNFTIDVQEISTEVILHSPLNSTILNSKEVNLTWGVRNATVEIPMFHIYAGSTEDNLVEVGTTEDTWYVLSNLTNDNIYYWYVIPSSGTSYGICSSGIWHFNVDTSFEAIYNITVELDVERLEIIQGNGTVFNITLANHGNMPTAVSLTPYGPISGFLNMSRKIVLLKDISKEIPVIIENISILPEGRYELSIEISHPGGMETIIIPINITSWKPVGSDDDTDDDVPDDDGSSKEPSDNWLFLVLGIIAVFVIASLVIILFMKRRKRGRSPHEGHYPDGVPVTPTVNVPPTVGVSPPQYSTNFQYSSPPPVQQSEPIYHQEMPFQPQETAPDYQVTYTQDYPPAGFQQIPPEPSPLVEEEVQSMLFTTYESVQCGICLGYVKTGAQAFLCKCKKTYHPTCGVRVGKCPVCGSSITNEDVGLIGERTVIKVGGKSESEKVSWGAEPRILGASDDFSISDMFLINIDGLLIKSLSFGTSVREGTDEDIMSGMLTAITDFIKDSFRDEAGGLKSLQYGRMNIYLERGVTFYLVVVFRGDSPDDLRKKMRFALIQLWEKYKHQLKVWNGTHDGLDGIENNILEYLGLELPPVPSSPEDDDYQPPKFTGEILTANPDEGEMPQVITTVDVTTTQGCYHLYNMLLAKKGSDIRIGGASSEADISKARKQIIMMYHPDRWQTDNDKANFFMKKVNVAWEVLSKRGDQPI